jgi:hypothetical protein
LTSTLVVFSAMAQSPSSLSAQSARFEIEILHRKSNASSDAL